MLDNVKDILSKEVKPFYEFFCDYVYEVQENNILAEVKHDIHHAIDSLDMEKKLRREYERLVSKW